MSKSILVASAAFCLLAGCGSSTEATKNQSSPDASAADVGSDATPPAANARGPRPGDAALLAGPDRPAPQVIDAHGLRLGMTVAQAQAAFRASGLPTSEEEASERYGKAWGFVLRRKIPENAADLEYISSIAARVPSTQRSSTPDEVLSAVFTPLRGRERVWGVTYGKAYAEAERPSVDNTLAALREKYGIWAFDTGLDTTRAGGVMLLWYWNDASQLGASDINETCRRAIHDTYIDQPTRNGTNNRAALDPAPLRAASDAGCAKVIRIFIEWNDVNAVTWMRIEAVDLRVASEASAELAGIVAGRTNADINARREAASRNQPTL